jgi:DNA-binding beta-propeller fold protein YncE
VTARTRRGFLGGAAAAALGAPALTGSEAQAAAGLVPAKRRTVRRGRAIAVAPRSGTIVVAHAARRTIGVRSHGKTRQVDVGGEPLEVAISPDGRLAAVTTAFWDEPGLALVHLAGRPQVVRVEVGDAPCGVAFTRDGARVLVSGGDEAGEVFSVDVRRRRVVARHGLPGCPRSIAVTGADRAWVALNSRARLALVDAKTARTLRTVRVPALPDRLAVSADGKRALVSHGGRDATRVTDVDLAKGRLRRHRAGRLPSGVGWSGERMVVALGGAGKIVVISRGGRVARHAVGGAPRGLAVVRRTAWTVDALSGKVGRVRL